MTNPLSPSTDEVSSSATYLTSRVHSRIFPSFPLEDDLPFSLNIQQVLFLAILAIAFLLLITEWLRNDVVAVLIILALSSTGVLSPSEALSGFGSEPAVIVACVFVLSGAVNKTGLSDALGVWISRLAGRNYGRTLAVVMLSAAFLSAFTHHVTTTALMLPMVISLCQERRLPPSRLLMPLSIAASLGTTVIVIAAPAFLVANDVLKQSGRPGLGIFSIAPIGLALCLGGILFMLLLGRFLLPVREGGRGLTNFYRLDRYFTEIKLSSGSTFIGKTVKEVMAKKKYHFETVGWMRDGTGQCRPLGDTKLREGDVLWVHAPPEDMIAFRQEKGIELHPIDRFGLEGGRFGEDGEDVADQLVQAVVAPGSDLIHRSLQELDFKSRYGAIVVGLWRRGGLLCQELGSIELEAGDVLVLQGSHESLMLISSNPAFLMMVPFHGEARLHRKAGLAGLVMLVTIAVAALDLVRLDMVMLAGAIAMVLLGCITARQAYRSIDSRIYVFIAGAVPLGAAIQKTGTAALMAQGLQSAFSGISPVIILLLIYALVALVTQFMSDAATTALFAPLAAALAQVLGHAPEPYVVTVAMAAVTAFLTPIGHHGNLLVYGPGNYRFSDFTRVGFPLTVLIAFLVVFISLVLWP